MCARPFCEKVGSCGTLDIMKEVQSIFNYTIYYWLKISESITILKLVLSYYEWILTQTQVISIRVNIMTAVKATIVICNFLFKMCAKPF
jgi:hypothetical protein